MKLNKKRSNRRLGVRGEREVIKLVSCPNCGKKLIALPSNYPLYDVQCTGCSFRAQIKTNNSKPKNEIFGATWEIMDKVLKAGFITPALLVNFQWFENSKKHSEIRFYPFVPRRNLRKRFTKIKNPKRALWMFNYTGMNDMKRVPYFILYKHN